MASSSSRSVKVPAFTGFSKDTFAFFRAIKKNNNKRWYEAHKDDYLTHVVEPAQAFVTALGPRLQKVAKTVQYDINHTGRGSVKRIHRDARFNKSGKPYKEYLGLIFWDGEGSKKEVPGFGLRLDETGGHFYAGMHGFASPKVRNTYREMVANGRSGKELERAVQSIQRARGYTIGGLHYKRVPREFDPEHERAELLKHNGLWALSPKITLTQLKSPKLVSQCAAYARKMAPLEQWLVKLWDNAN